MAFLEAGAAFAVLMIIFSTIATSIVELVHKILGTRAKHLKRALGYLFENIIWPRVGHRLPRISDRETDDRAKARHAELFVTLLTANPISVMRGKDNLGKARWTPATGTSEYGRVKRAWAGNNVDYLTALSFAERLGRTEVGKAILDEGEDFIDELVTDFVRSFDRLSRAATDFVGNRARAVSIVVGVGLALGVNIDASRLITTLIEDPVLRSGLIEQGEEANKANQEANEQLTKLMEQVKTGAFEGVEPADVKSRFDEIGASLDELTVGGIPIGYDYYPWAELGDCQEKVWKCWTDSTEQSWQFVRWIFMCILSGLLIGLGGPFWYEVFRRLSQVTQIARSFGLGALKKSEKTDTTVKPEQPAAAADPTVPVNPIDSFRTAARTHYALVASGPDEPGRRARNAGLTYVRNKP